VTLDAPPGTLLQRYQAYWGANVVATGVAVFERDKSGNVDLRTGDEFSEECKSRR
jgi:hypothetical protein